MYCIGCGDPLQLAATRCPACKTSAAGMILFEKVILEYGRAAVVPPVCCCCLAPRQETRAEELSTILLSGDKRYTKVSIPWCTGCLRRRGAYGRMASIGCVVGGVVVYFVFARFLGDLAFLLALIGGAAFYVLTAPLLSRALPTMRLPGHVPSCDAVHGSAGQKNAQLVLGNRAFAQIWRDLQAGLPVHAPALAWAEREVSIEDDPVPRVPPPNTVAEARARVRDQLATGQAPYRARRFSFGPRPVGVDAASEILRFAVKTLEIRHDRFSATDRSSSAREVSFDEVVSVAARRTPEQPPFEGTIFLDVVPRSGTPLRIVPTSRVNYGQLPGSGATSHENFRRLVSYLKTKCPEITIEGESKPYLADGKGFPPLLETTDDIVRFDARYLAESPPLLDG